jgi:hypothetical protein
MSSQSFWLWMRRRVKKFERYDSMNWSFDIDKKAIPTVDIDVAIGCLEDFLESHS